MLSEQALADMSMLEIGLEIQRLHEATKHLDPKSSMEYQRANSDIRQLYDEWQRRYQILKDDGVFDEQG